MHRLILVATAMMLFAAPAQAASVTWPAKRVYAPGEPLVVKVASKRSVRVALVRESASGRIMRVIARQVLRKGTFSAAAPSAGRYALRVGGRHRTVTVTAPPTRVAATPAPVVATPVPEPPYDCQNTLSGTPQTSVAPLAARAGEALAATTTNLGPGCIGIQTTSHDTWQRETPTGWEPVDLSCTGEVLGPGDPRPMCLDLPALTELAPGKSVSRPVTVPAGLAPGRYLLTLGMQRNYYGDAPAGAFTHVVDVEPA